METKETKTFYTKGSRGERYDIILKFLMESKRIYFIDCTCKDFQHRRLKQIGEFSDIKITAFPCKHLKPIIEFYEKEYGFKLKEIKIMDGSDKLTAEIKRQIIERSKGICEASECQDKATKFHRIVRGSNGGKYTLGNTRHICATHHDLIHSNEFPTSKAK